MNLLSLTQNEINVILTTTANHFNFNTNVIEKDWWVTMVLKALFQTSDAEYFTFKGGTSLSKGWGIIERFSEDIDIAIDKSLWNIAGSTKNQREKIRKKSRKYIKDQLIPELETNLQSIGAKNYSIEFVHNDNSDKDPTICLIPYKSFCNHNEYVETRIKIEFSCRSLKEPRVEIKIKPYIQDVFPNDFQDFVFNVYAAHPSRTFLEKIFLIHEELQKKQTRITRMSRHLYDIAKLMDTEYAKIALSDPQLYKNIIIHRSIFNAIKGINYATHLPTTINFIPPENVNQLWKIDYEKMVQNAFIYGNTLTYNELIKKLIKLKEQIKHMRL